MRRAQAVALALCVTGATLALLSSGRHWVTVSASAPLGGGRTAVRGIGVRGSDLTGVLGPLGLVGLAGAAAVLATRGLARVLVGLLLAAAGAGAGIAVLRVALDPERPARLALQAQGRTESLVSADLGAWGLIAVAAPFCVLAAGALVALRGRAWSALSQRYDAPTARVPAVAEAAPRDPDAALWDALDRGDDPTR